MIHLIQAGRRLGLLAPATFLLLLVEFSRLKHLLLATLDHLSLLIIRQPHGNVAITVLGSTATREVDAGTATLDDDTLDFFLLHGSLTNPLFDRASGDETIHRDLSGLTQSVGSVHGLRVDGWVPIRVVEDDRVRRCKVDTKTTGTGGQQENEDFRASLEVVYG